MGWQDAPEVTEKPKWQSAPEVTAAGTTLPAKPQSRDEAYKEFKKGGWGTGLPKLAYDLGGKVTDVAAQAGASPEVAAGLGFATNVGTEAVPAILGGFAAGKAAAPAMEKTAKNLMQSALKPTYSDLKSGDAAKAIQTMLDEGVNVTPGGVQKLRASIDDLNQEISQAIAQSPASVSKGAVGAELLGTLRKFARQVNPNADIAAIKGAWQEFMNHPLFTGNTIPVQDAQALKQGTYRVLAGKYGEVGSAETEAQKALARGLKNEVASAVPSVAPLNAKESQLINALDVAERRVLMKYNNNPMGLSLLAKNPGAWAAFMADRSPLFKSLVARMLYSGSEAIPQAAAGVGIATLEAAQPR